MKKYGNLTIVASLLLVMLTVVGLLTFGAIQTNDRNERLIADLNNNFELKISQIEDKITGQKTIVVERTYNQNARDGKNGITPECYFSESKCVGSNGKDGINGTNGLNGQNATAEQIAVAVSQYLAANPPQQGPKGDTGDAGNAREIIICKMENGKYGQRYTDESVCRPIEVEE